MGKIKKEEIGGGGGWGGTDTLEETEASDTPRAKSKYSLIPIHTNLKTH
jgi:hypothetical protein